MSTTSPSELQYMKTHLNHHRRSHIIKANVHFKKKAYVAVGLRIYARHLTPAGFGADDLLILVALVSSPKCFLIVVTNVLIGDFHWLRCRQ